LDPHILASKILEWVREDAPFGDITTELLVPEGRSVEAVIIAKSSGVVACVSDVARALKILGLEAAPLVGDGEEVRRGTAVMKLGGDARSILLFERTILNILMLLAGIATKTRKIVDIVRSVNPRVRVAATRKVVPGLRALVKKAVALGGGDTHRFSLSDAILIKDNHIAIVGDVEKAVRLAKSRASFAHKVEVEVTEPSDAVRAARAGADIVMLDNMSPSKVAEALELLKREGLRDRVVVEVSGGIDEDNVAAYAKLDPDVISTSVITMKPERVDMSLEIERLL